MEGENRLGAAGRNGEHMYTNRVESAKQTEAGLRTLINRSAECGPDGNWLAKNKSWAWGGLPVHF